MAEEISREGAGQRIAYNVALHIGTKEIENVEMAKRKWAVSSRKAAGSGLQRNPSAEASGRGGWKRKRVARATVLPFSHSSMNFQ